MDVEIWRYGDGDGAETFTSDVPKVILVAVYVYILDNKREERAYAGTGSSANYSLHAYLLRVTLYTTHSSAC